jgi:hypothetical protein
VSFRTFDDVWALAIPEKCSDRHTCVLDMSDRDRNEPRRPVTLAARPWRTLETSLSKKQRFQAFGRAVSRDTD